MIKNKAITAFRIAKKYSPQILVGLGIVGGLATTALACKKTLELDGVEEFHDGLDMIDRVKEGREKHSIQEYSNDSYYKDIITAYRTTIFAVGKHYLPVISTGALSVLAILSAHKILSRRNLILATAYKGLEETFVAYRKRTQAALGKAEENKHFSEVLLNVPYELPEEEEAEEGERLRPLGSVYAKVFDEYSVYWEKSAFHNIQFLMAQEQYANDLLKSRGSLFLHEVYDMLGIPRTPISSVVGWVRGVGDDFVDFGIFDLVNDPESQIRTNFINGSTNWVLLDFNVQGVIYDLL